MPDVKLPLSGDVSQVIAPWTTFFRAIGSQFGLININLGKSSNPDVEKEILDDVGSYGKQLGKLADAVQVLIAHLPANVALKPSEKNALSDLEKMLDDIRRVKNRHTPAQNAKGS